MNTEVLLKQWLVLVALAHVIGGIALPLWAYTEGFAFYADQLNVRFWGAVDVPAAALDFERWIVALFGPTVAAWGVLMWTIVRRDQVDARSWIGVLASLLVWAPLDMGISLIHGFWPHVVLDTAVLLAVGLPVVLLWLRARERERLDREVQ